MKILPVCTLLSLFAMADVLAQSVSVEVALDQEQYISSEDLVARVRITNFSGQTLTLGNDDTWLSFSIDGGPNRIVSQRAIPPVRGEFQLDSSTIGTRRVNISPYFDLTRPGRYTVTATVRIPQIGLQVQSKPKAFNIISGTVLWQQDFGVPLDPNAEDTTPEVRKYALLQVTHEKDLKLYFRLTDASSAKPYRVFPIGPLISFSKPEGQLDRFNNLHVLYQTGARSFLYTAINPEGVVIARETHDIATSRPTLRADKDGRISVTGGIRRYTSSDLPPVFDSTTTTDALSPQP